MKDRVQYEQRGEENCFEKKISRRVQFYIRHTKTVPSSGVDGDYIDLIVLHRWIEFGIQRYPMVRNNKSTNLGL